MSLLQHRHRLPYLFFILGVCGAAVVCSCGDKREAFTTESFYIADELTLRYWMPSTPDHLDANDLSLHTIYAELERVTGIHLDFEYPYAERPENQLQALLNSDDLPDIIEWNWLEWYPGGPQAAIDEGIIRPLKDLVVQFAPNFFKLFADDEEIARLITTESGAFYAVPHLTVENETRAQAGLLVREKWLEQIDFAIPETIPEWRSMMRTMAETDFATFGSDSEYPLFFPAFRDLLASETVYYFLAESNAFAGAWGVSHDLYRDDAGRIRYGPVQPGYRDMLVELNGWYEEDLIHPVISSPASGRGYINILAKCGATIGTNQVLSFVEQISFVQAPPPSLGDANAPVLGSQMLPVYDGTRAAAISAATEQAEAAVRFLDIGYSEWGNRLYNFGVEGVSYGLERSQPVIAGEILESYRKAAGRFDTGDINKHSRGLWGGPFALSGLLLKQLSGRSAEEENPWLVAASEVADGVMRYDAGRRGEYLPIMNAVRNHAGRSFAEFVSGQRSLDEFDEFVREIEHLQINDAISLIYNAEADFYTKPIY